MNTSTTASLESFLEKAEQTIENLKRSDKEIGERIRQQLFLSTKMPQLQMKLQEMKFYTRIPLSLVARTPKQLIWLVWVGDPENATHATPSQMLYVDVSNYKMWAVKIIFV